MGGVRQRIGYDRGKQWCLREVEKGIAQPHFDSKIAQNWGIAQPRSMFVPFTALAFSDVAKKFLPRNLEFLIKETYDWLSRSSSRQEAYKDLYKLINDGKDPLKIVQ